jgi:uncharacterized membrane protein SirB2
VLLHLSVSLAIILLLHLRAWKKSSKIKQSNEDLKTRRNDQFYHTICWFFGVVSIAWASNYAFYKRAQPKLVLTLLLLSGLKIHVVTTQ